MTNTQYALSRGPRIPILVYCIHIGSGREITPCMLVDVSDHANAIKLTFVETAWVRSIGRYPNICLFVSVISFVYQQSN